MEMPMWVPFLGENSKFFGSQGHEKINFFNWSFKIFDTKGVNSHRLNAKPESVIKQLRILYIDVDVIRV